MSEGSFEHAMYMMEATHQVLHDKEPDYEDTLMMSLTEVDCLVIGLGMACLFFDYPCLQHLSSSLQRRMIELAQAQRPEWVVTDDGEE